MPAVKERRQLEATCRQHSYSPTPALFGLPVWPPGEREPHVKKRVAQTHCTCPEPRKLRSAAPEKPLLTSEAYDVYEGHRALIAAVQHDVNHVNPYVPSSLLSHGVLASTFCIRAHIARQYRPETMASNAGFWTLYQIRYQPVDAAGVALQER